MWWLATSALLGLSAAAGDSELDSFLRLLERHGLTRLELVALEQALDRNLIEAERHPLLARLSLAIANTAEQSQNPAEVGALRERLDAACDKAGDEAAARMGRLRLAMHEADLIRVQLLRCMVDGCEAIVGADLSNAAAELEVPLGKLLDECEKERRDAEKALDRVSAAEAPRAGTRLARAERAGEEARLRMGWLLLARAWKARQAGGEDTAVRAAAWQSLPFFARVLAVTDGCVDPVEASLDMRAEQWYAEAILGVALARSLSGVWSEAEPWVATLGNAPMAESIRGHASAWEVLLALEAGAPESATAALGRAGSAAAACEAARLVLRRLQEQRMRGAIPELLGAEAVRVLVTRCGWAALAEAAPDATRMPEGFTRACAEVASGVGSTQSNDPRSTVKSVRAAISARPEPLRAFDPWLQVAAAEALLKAAESSPQARAEFALEAREMARVAKKCEDAQLAADAAALELAAAAGTEGDSAAVAVLRREFLARFPDDARSDGLRVESAESGVPMNDAALADLLNIRLGTPEGPRARRAASRVMYERFLAASGESRAPAAAGLLALEAPESAAWPKGSVDVVVRRQLHAALDPAVRDVQRAAELMALARSHGVITERAVAEELGLREVELAVALDQLELSLSAAAALPAGAPANEARELVLAALWRKVSAGERLPLSDESMTIAQRLIAETVTAAGLTPADCARRAAAAQILISMGETADVSRAAEALRAVAPCADAPDASNATLRTAADAAFASGSVQAQTWLAKLSARLDPCTPECCRARAELVGMLISTDPGAARRLLQQHQVFVPEWGPAPWGAKLQELAASLGVREVGQ